MIEKSMGEIKWDATTSHIDAKIRGLNPWPVGYTYYEGNVMKVWLAQAASIHGETAPAGTILSVGKEGLVVKTGDGALLIQEIQMPNKKRMPVSEYIKGNTLAVGTLLGI